MYPRSQPFNLSGTGDTHVGDFEDISTRTLLSVRVGQGAGKISSGSGNAFVGYDAGKANLNGNYNAMIGYQAGAQNANASYVTMVGAFAGAQNQRGNEVTFVGYRAGELSKDGNQLVGVGAYSLRENVSGNGTVAVGYRSAERTLDGYYNTMIGTESGQDNRSGNFNTMAGYRSGRSAFLGNENTYLGAFSGYSNRTGSGNSLVGYRAGEELTDGDLNVAIGAYSMQYASVASSNIAIGPFAAANVNKSSSENVLIGTLVGKNAAPNRSVLLGALAGQNMEGDASVLIGYNVGYDLIYGNCNIFIGPGATSFLPSNECGIAIGANSVRTFTNSISVGNNITNQREYSIILGNDIASDANNSIVLGKANSVESLIVWKDPISATFLNTVLIDGRNKIGLCNVEYSDTVVSPCNAVFANATVGVFASNVESSLTNPLSSTQIALSYDLRNVVAEHIINNGVFACLRTSNEFSIAIENDARLAVSPAVLSASKPFTVSPNAAKISDLILNPSSVARVSLNDHAVSNVAVNVRKTEQIDATIPIEFALRHVEPEIPQNDVFAYIDNSAVRSLEVQLTLSNLNLSVTCNLNNGVFLSTSNELMYVLEVPPSYGSVNNAIFDSNHDIKYTPWAESGFITSDSFEVRPVYTIHDINNNRYGIPASNTVKVNVTFQPGNTEVYYCPSVAMTNNFVLTSNIVFGIPQFLPNAEVRILHIPSNVEVITPWRNLSYTSNEIMQLVEQNRYDYPDEKYESYLNQNIGIIDDLLHLQYEYASNASVYIYDIVSITRDLSMMMTDLTEANAVLAIENNAISVLNTDFTPTLVTSNIMIDLTNSILDWQSQYDPLGTINAPYTEQLIASNEYWNNVYFDSGLYKSWADTKTFSNMYQIVRGNEVQLSNLIANFHTNTAVTITYDATTSQTAQRIMPDFNTIYYAYFTDPRLFLTYDDIIHNRIQFVATNSDTFGYWDETVQMTVETSNIDILFRSGSNQIWEDIQYNTSPIQTFYVPFSSNMKPFMIDVGIYTGYDQSLIIRNPSNGALKELSYRHISYIPSNPWANADSFGFVLKNTSGETVDYPVNIKFVNDQIRLLPALVVHPTVEQNPSSSLSTSVYTYDIQRIPFTVSNVIIRNRIFNNVQEVTNEISSSLISTYDHQAGYTYTHSNEYITTSITPFQIIGPLYYTCNIHINSFTYNALNGAWIEHPQYTNVRTQTVAQTGNVRGSNIIIDYNLSLVTSNLFAYTSNTVIIDKDDVYHSYVDSIQNRFMYANEYEGLQRHPMDVISSLSIDIASSSDLYHETVFKSVRSNIVEFKPFTPLSRNNIQGVFTQSSVILLENTDPFHVIRSNVGITNLINPLSDLDYGDLWITYSNYMNILPSPEFSILHTSVGNIPIHIANGDPQIQVVPQQFTLQISLDTCRTKIINIFQALESYIDFTPYALHFYNVDNGCFVMDGSNVATNIRWEDRTRIEYVAHTPQLVNNETMYIVLIDSDNVTSNVFKVSAYINFTASTRTYTFNKGVNVFGQCNNLDPRAFFYSYNNTPLNDIKIQVTSYPSSDVRFYRKTATNYQLLQPPFFTMQEVYDYRIYLQFPTNATYANVTFDVKRGIETLYQGEQLSILTVSHIAYPPLALQQTPLELSFTSLGYDLTYQSQLSDIFTQWFGSWIYDNQSVPLENIYVTACASPEHGYFILKDDANAIPHVVHEFTLHDLQQNRLRYVPRIPGNLVEETVPMRICYKDTWSPSYDLVLRHYVSHFYPYGLNVSHYDVSDRSVITPNRSISMIQKGFSWTTSCNMVIDHNDISDAKIFAWHYSGNSNIYNWTVSLYALNNRFETQQTELTLYVDCADSIALNALTSVVPGGITESLYIYISSQPQYGIIQNKLNGSVLVRIPYELLDTSNIIYQHIGDVSSKNDEFKVVITSSPYSLSLQECTVRIVINPLPIVTTNLKKYVYYDDVSQTTTIQPFTQNILAFKDAGYIHITSVSNLEVVDLQGRAVTSFNVASSNQYGIRIDANVFTDVNPPYPAATFEYVLSSQPTFSVNPLSQIPLYKDLFIHDFTSVVNQHIDRNVILAETESNQIIAYDIDLSVGTLIPLANKTSIISFELYPKPSYKHPQFDLFLTDNFSFHLYGVESAFFSFTVYDTTWTLTINDVVAGSRTYTGQILTSLNRSEWNTIKVVNNDTVNNYNTSIYWKYGSASEVNLLDGINVPSFSLEKCVRYEFRANIRDPLVYISSCNYVKYFSGSSSIATTFELDNAYLSYLVRSFQVNVATYDIDKVTYDPISHNIIVGKDIYVQGVDNICLGNNFVTSGNQSIIVGNSIGGGTQNSSSVNDIFQSIILGNTSFKNSIVRDIICIGNDNFNNLSEEDTSKTRFFFSQKPIVIANDVDTSKIDYNINIGNVFLNTNVGQKQIYLGINQQVVAIGYSSNEQLSPDPHILHVKGSIRTDALSATYNIKECISSAFIPQYSVVKDNGYIDIDNVSISTSTSNTMIVGVAHASVQQPNGEYSVRVITRGKTKVWCSSVVNPGELLVSDGVGCVISRSSDTTLHSFTFAKSLVAWDPLLSQNTPEITTSNIDNYGLVGLIPCVLLI